MEYLKLFQNHSEYGDFVSGGTMVKPNVSHCVNENEVHYNPIETRLIVKYVPTFRKVVKPTLPETGQPSLDLAIEPTQLYFFVSEDDITINGAAMFDKVEINDVEVSIADLDAASGQTQFVKSLFETALEHTVKYTLKDPTFIGLEQNFEQFPPTITKFGAYFEQCNDICSVEIPNTVTNIGNEAFAYCSGLTSLDIPDSVTTIGTAAFYECDGLTSLTIGSGVKLIRLQNLL